MRGVRIRAYAKINPILRVGRPRADGYHDLWTTFRAIDLHDFVEIVPSTETRIVCNVSELSGEANLASKALRLLSELIEIPPLEVSIDKRIPVEAGLGGGSSDAAAVLSGVHTLLGRPVSESDLLDIGAACGSDVPFFLLGESFGVGTGRGEHVCALPPIQSQHLVVAKPSIGCRTAEMYAALRERSGSDPPFDDVPHNDFDAIAPAESKELIDRMDGHLCGSGSAVWAYSDSEHAASELARQLQSDGYWAIATRTLERVEELEWIA